MTKKNTPLSAPSVLKWSTRLLAATGAAAMALSGELDPMLLFLFLGFFLMGLWVEKWPSLLSVLGKIQPILALAAFGLGVFDFLYLSKSFLLAIAHFLLLIQGLRLLVLVTARENLGSILLSSMMILSASTLEIKWTFLLMLALFLPAAVWTLIVYNLVNESHSMAREARALEGEAEESLEKYDLLRENSPAWKKLAPSIRRSTAASFFVAGLCCLIVFVIFPRFNFRSFKGRFLQPVHKTGFTNEMDLKKGGRILSDESVAMRIVVAPEDRSLWTGYLSGSILNEFDGQIWKKRIDRQFRIQTDANGRVLLGKPPDPNSPLLQQEIFLESMESPVLFGAPDPVWFKVSRPFLDIFPDGTIQRPFGDAWRIQYEVGSSPSAPFDGGLRQGKPRALRGRKFGPPEKADSEWKNPSPRVASLARDVTAKAANPLEAALMLSHFLQTKYEYSLGGEAGRADNPVESFLFDVKRGHCEYFASSFCLMARSLNIPARIVTGFKTHEWNERGEYYVARMKNAHSWAEIYAEPYGWVEFDPTPLTVPASPGAQSWGDRYSQFMDYMNLRWNRYILSYDHQRQLEIARDVYSQSKEISNRFGRWTGQMGAWSDWFKKRMAGVSVEKPDLTPKDIQGLVFFLAALGFGVAWFLIKKKKSISPVWFYAALVSLLKKSGVPKEDSQTLNEYLEKISTRLGPAKAPAEKLASLYTEARFKGRPLSAEKTDQVNDLLRELRRGMKK